MKPTRASYSSITTFETCPASYEYAYLSDNPIDSSSPATRRGTRLHKACEDYLKGITPITRLPVELLPIKDYLSVFLQLQAISEEVWLVNRDWGTQDEEDSNTFIKGVVDIHYVLDNSLFIVDLKTGKAYPEHADQLQLYALMGLIKYPEVKEALVSAVYLDGPGDITRYARDQLEGLKIFWGNRVLNLLNATEYPFTPSRESCKWCPYAKSKKGPCNYG